MVKNLLCGSWLTFIDGRDNRGVCIVPSDKINPNMREISDSRLPTINYGFDNVRADKEEICEVNLN